MKTIYTLFIALFLTSLVSGQNRFLTKKGNVSFFSEAIVENIEAKNNQVLSIVDATNGEMAISILMKSFMFEKALMQEHFNENYIESDKFPKAIFKGTIMAFKEIEVSETQARIKGLLSMHGKSKKVTILATITKTMKTIVMNGSFFIDLVDFNVAIPSAVKNNIANKIKVSFKLNHKPYKN